MTIASFWTTQTLLGGFSFRAIGIRSRGTGIAAHRLRFWPACNDEQAEDLPPVLRAVVALGAWGEISVLQHAPWLGRLLAASILRQLV